MPEGSAWVAPYFVRGQYRVFGEGSGVYLGCGGCLGISLFFVLLEAEECLFGLGEAFAGEGVPNAVHLGVMTGEPRGGG